MKTNSAKNIRIDQRETNGGTKRIKTWGISLLLLTALLLLLSAVALVRVPRTVQFDNSLAYTD